MKQLNKSVLLILGAALLAGLTLLAYSPAFHGGFIFDDNVLLTQNPLIRAPDGWRRFWLSREAADYWPVTSSALWLEWRLWGLNAAGYHCVNVGLHLAEGLILWTVLWRLRVPGAFLGALVFTLHPVNAESVVWISQLKNLLSMLFYLLAILWYVPAEGMAAEGEAGFSSPRYWLSLGAFMFALLSKGSVVFLPLVLMGLVAWHRRPTRRDWSGLLPFFLVAAALAAVEARSSTITGFAVQSGSGFFRPAARAGIMVWFYLGKALYPANLMFAYPPWAHLRLDLEGWLPFLAAVGLTLVLAICARRGQRFARGALLAWVYFCAALLPVLGFAEVGFMRYTPVSNHYEHLAIIGVAAGVAAAWASALQPGWTLRTVGLLGGAVGVVILLGFLTWQQARIYRDAETLYTDTLLRNPASWMAENNLGAVWLGQGKLPQAQDRFEAALRLNPDYAEADNNLGLTLVRMGRLPEAMDRYRAALRLEPGFYAAENNLGAALARAGRLAEAVPHFERALVLAPDYPEARSNLDRALKLSSGGGLK